MSIDNFYTDAKYAVTGEHRTPVTERLAQSAGASESTWAKINQVATVVFSTVGFIGGPTAADAQAAGLEITRLTDADIEAAINTPRSGGPLVQIQTAGDLRSGGVGVQPEGYYQDAVRFPASSSAQGAAPGTTAITEFRVHTPTPKAVSEYPGSNAATGNTMNFNQGNRSMLPSGQWTTRAQRNADSGLANDVHIPIHRDVRCLGAADTLSSAASSSPVLPSAANLSGVFRLFRLGGGLV